jgi:hypothetical protein
MCSLAALILRDFMYRNGAPQIFEHLTEAREVYRNGYFMPFRARDKNRLLHELTNIVGNLSILAQWGVPQAGKPPMMQVFTAAPSYQNANPGPEAGPICSLLVTQQYAAIGQLAAMRSVLIGERVPLHLTLVGQGAFNNPESVMKDALRAVTETVQGYDVDLFLHGYGPADIDRIVRLTPSDVEWKLWNSDRFFGRKSVQS